MTALDGLHDIWSSTYNAPDSALPLILPAILWTCCWLYARSKKIDYGNWHEVHQLHHAVAIFFAGLSIYFNDDAVLNERIGILWSLSYFVVDLTDSIVKGDKAYTAHALFCLALGATNYYMPLSRRLRMNSKASFMEASTPLLHRAKKSRDPIVFSLFALVFTCCRIVWMPFLIKELHSNGLSWLHPAILTMLGFYSLNWYWYVKILRILWKDLRGGTKESKIQSDDTGAVVDASEEVDTVKVKNA